MIKFDWDENKNVTNIEKHKVSFEESSTTFYDDDAIILDDPDHSDESEERFLLIGISVRLNLLIVSHCYRNEDEDNETIRIISARKANKHETNKYFERKKV